MRRAAPRDNVKPPQEPRPQGRANPTPTRKRVTTVDEDTRPVNEEDIEQHTQWERDTSEVK